MPKSDTVLTDQKSADQQMLDRLSMEGATGWNPEEGETILGTVASIKASAPNEWGIYPIVTLADDEGKLTAVHCFHSVLKGRLLEKRPVVGEKVAIRYEGIVEGKHSKARGGSREPYRNYTVVVDRPDADTSMAQWDTFDTDVDLTSEAVDEG